MVCCFQFIGIIFKHGIDWEHFDCADVIFSHVVGMLQFITFGFACTPLYFVWEKVIGMHDTKSICLRALARLPVVIPIWFLAIIFPFFGPINSAVGSLLVSFTVYIIPALAHMLTFRSASARQVMLQSSLIREQGTLSVLFHGIYSFTCIVILGSWKWLPMQQAGFFPPTSFINGWDLNVCVTWIRLVKFPFLAVCGTFHTYSDLVIS